MFFADFGIIIYGITQTKNNEKGCIMAQIKISFKGGSDNGSVSLIQKKLNLLFNNEKIGSTDAKEADAIAKANGQKNMSAFLIEGKAALAGSWIDVKAKGSNELKLVIGDKKEKVINVEAGDDAKIHVIIKKRGFFSGLILGKYKLKAKA